MPAPARPLRTPLTLAIAGPTASGKSAAALHLAQRLQARGQAVEIVSVDSALVYRGMDIGTAKPSRQERAICPHHLIDVRDPLHPWSAADFVRAVHELLPHIHARGALALLVGGTMLYYQALLHGLDDMPGADAAIRQQLEQEAAEVGWPALHARLGEVDAQTAARLSPQDGQRIQRALEVWHISGQPLSSFHARRSMRAAPADGVIAPGGFFSLEPAAGRAWLDARIARRLDAMLAAGLVDEVRALRARGDLHAELPAMRCVGYRQVWQMLDEAPGAPAQGPDGLHGRIYVATRQLAKRQMTWLRAMPWRQVIACEEPNKEELLAQSILNFMDYLY